MLRKGSASRPINLESRWHPHRPGPRNAVDWYWKRDKCVLPAVGFAASGTAALGFRSTASSILNESGRWNPDAIERAFAHQDKNAVRAVYNRTAYWDERVEMMQWWSDKLDSVKAGQFD